MNRAETSSALLNHHPVRVSGTQLILFVLLVTHVSGCGGMVIADAKGIRQPVLVGPVLQIGPNEAAIEPQTLAPFDARLTNEGIGAGTSSTHSTATHVITTTTSYQFGVISSEDAFRRYVLHGLQESPHRFIQIDDLDCEGGSMLAITAFSHWNECRIRGEIRRPEGKLDWR